MHKVCLITPPFTQLNTPYPATPYLKGFLNTKGIASTQIDLGIEVVLSLFSTSGLRNMFRIAESKNHAFSENSARIFALRSHYCKVIDTTITFLQAPNITFAHLICGNNYLPQAARFKQVADLELAFGNMGIVDKAKHLATLFLEDISDFIIECVDEDFGFSRYAEKIGRSANSFDQLYAKLNQKPTFIDQIAFALLDNKFSEQLPDLVCFSIPFPGNLYSAFRCAKHIKQHYPTIKIAIGGGFPNTELRSISDIRIFEFTDFITLDDGELPLELIIENCTKNNTATTNEPLFKRTFLQKENQIAFVNNCETSDYAISMVGTPDYSDLPLKKYISVIEVTNPMHSLWSDGRWNKLTMAHGCYWGKCTFCDVSLHYISHFEQCTAKALVDKMELLIAQTGERGFHFVDEAAPPALMRAVALEIIARGLGVSWWTNIRFEKSFTADLCKLLKLSGCIAVSGGLEVASDRLLKLINKGVTVEQVAQVTHHFSKAGIMVHAYLMYGFPSQTVQETIDSMEMVRQLFLHNTIQSAFWHQFALTAHSGVGLNPKEFGIKPIEKPISFANNDVEFVDKTRIDHQQFSFGLKKSLYNFMHGICLESPLQQWFDFKIPRTTIAKNHILNCLEADDNTFVNSSARIVWLGNTPRVGYETKSKKGMTKAIARLMFDQLTTTYEVVVDKDKSEWLLQLLDKCAIQNQTPITFEMAKIDFEKQFHDFELFWYSKPIHILRKAQLLVI